jgi:Flp pilus assembly protein protease CpaA
MEREPLLVLLLALYLLPCAVQDVRTRHVSNWLTIPAFVVAWPLALWLGTLPFTLAVFVGCYVAWHAGGMGPADGKLATLTVAVAPEALLMASLLVALVFVTGRVCCSRPVATPGALWLLIGVTCALGYRL